MRQLPQIGPVGARPKDLEVALEEDGRVDDAFPSGDQRGPSSNSEPLSVLTRRTPEPWAFMTKIDEPDVNAIRRPSGDHAGQSARRRSLVAARSRTRMT